MPLTEPAHNRNIAPLDRKEGSLEHIRAEVEAAVVLERESPSYYNVIMQDRLPKITAFLKAQKLLPREKERHEQVAAIFKAAFGNKGFEHFDQWLGTSNEYTETDAKAAWTAAPAWKWRDSLFNIFAALPVASIISAQTEPDYYPDEYSGSDNGLFYAPKVKPGETPQPIWLGPPIYFLARARDAYSESWGVVLEWQDPDGKTHRWVLLYELLTDSQQKWRTRLAKGGYIGATSQAAKALLGDLLAKIKPSSRALCVAVIGWHDGRFVFPDAVYGIGKEMLVLQTEQSVHPFTQAGNLYTWNKHLGTWCQGNSRLVFAVCLSLSGPLLSLVGMDSSGAHFFGNSSSGKTTLLHVARSVWGGKDMMRSWRSTSNALEATAAMHNDCCMVLDEIGQASGKVVSEAAYLLLNGTGKARANQDGSAKGVTSWRVTILSNGEMKLENKIQEDGQQSQAGQAVRLVDIPADAGAGLGAWENLHGFATPGLFSDALKEAATINYGILGRVWVNFLAENQDQATALRGKIETVVTKWAAGGSSGQVRRVATRFALIGLAGELATSNGLLPWEDGASLAAAHRCFRDWLHARGGTGDREDIHALEIIKGYIARFGGSRFQTIAPGVDDLPPTNTYERIAERAGFRRSTHKGQEQFIFTTEQWKEIFRGRNPAQAAKAMAAVGVLVCNDGRNLTQKISLPDLGRVRAYVVHLPDEPEDNVS